MRRLRHRVEGGDEPGRADQARQQRRYAFVRSGGAAKPVTVALNRGTGASSAAIPVGGSYPNGTTLTDQLSGATVSVSGGKVNVSVPGRGGLTLVGS
jgi:hypothetical protein